MNVLNESSKTHADNVFFLLNISERIGKEYVLMCDDLLRMFVIQFTIQMMMYLASPTTNSFISAEFVVLLFYILLGVSFYWLVFRNVVAFT
jgi:hypothetical protein